MTSNSPEPPQPPEPPGHLPAFPSAPPLSDPAGQAPEQWAWAHGQQPTQIVESEPLEYHRLLRGVPNYRWWKPLLLLLLAGAYFLVLSILVGVLFLPISLIADPTYFTDIMSGDAELLDTQRPFTVAFAMVSIIVMIPSVLLAMLTMGMRPVGRAWSVAGKIRWGLLFRLVAVSFIALFVMNFSGIAFEFALNPSSLSESTEVGATAQSDFDMNAALISLLLVVLLVPFQATAEEIVFRGLFMQVLGSWVKSPWLAILLPSVAFSLAHIYNIWGLLAVGLLGVVAAWLTWRTGGLEAAIAIHIVNNVIAFGFLTFAVGGETAQTEDGGGLGSVIGQVLGLAVFVWLTLWIFKRGRYGRTRIDLLRVAAPANFAPPVQQYPGAHAATYEDDAPRG